MSDRDPALASTPMEASTAREPSPQSGVPDPEGDYKNGVAAGRGVLVTPQGMTYDGEWSAGVMHGHGVSWPTLAQPSELV